MVGMKATKHNILGSDYVGAFCICTDAYTIIPEMVGNSLKHIVEETFGTEVFTGKLSNSDLLGIFGRANSNGLVLSNTTYEAEITELKRSKSINIGVIESDLNAVGNNIITNDKVAFINPEYSPKAAKEVSDVLGVEVFPMKIGYFKTLGSSNILTNRGMALNNTVSDEQKERIEEMLGIKTTRTTANTGSLNIGIAAVANSNGIMTGNSTTGFELARLIQTLE